MKGYIIRPENTEFYLSGTKIKFNPGFIMTDQEKCNIA